MSKQNIDFDRKRYEEALGYYGDFELAPQYSSLRFEAEFVKGKGVYEFLVNRPGQSSRATERYLKQNDLFVTKGIAVGIMVETVGKEGHAPVMYYPVLQSDALPVGYNGLANTDAEALYNGILAIITGSTNNFGAFPLDEFRIVPRTQPIAMVNSDASALIPSGLIPEWSADDVLCHMPERFAFAGTQDQKIQISFPANANTDVKGEAGTKTYLVVTVKGWLVEGGTNSKFKTTSNKKGQQNPFAGII